MNQFKNDREKIDFLKKYKLLSETATELSTFYYFEPGSNVPLICDVIGYEETFDTWASITIKVDNEALNIHSDYFSDMKKRGRTFYKNNHPAPNNTNDSDAYIVFDLETTGINYKKDSIMEIAAIKCTNQGIYEFNKLVKTDSDIPANITSLTGITNEMLNDAEPIEDILPEFIQFIGTCRLVGHNIKSFDIIFLNNACKQLGLPNIENELVDTLPIAKKALPDLENHKLSTICEFFNIDNSKAHRALADCYMCDECYRRMVDGYDSIVGSSLAIYVKQNQ